MWYLSSSTYNFVGTHNVSIFIADVMKSKGANTVIAVDVGSEYPAELTNYGDHLSGWWLLWKKWNPFGEKIYVSAMWYGIVLCCAVLCNALLCYGKTQKSP